MALSRANAVENDSPSSRKSRAGLRRLLADPLTAGLLMIIAAPAHSLAQ
jgi:hypothetical protein